MKELGDIVEAARTLIAIQERCSELNLLFEKELTKSDANPKQCGLLLPKASVENCMIPHFVDEQKAAMMNESKLELSVHDPDHRMDHTFVLKKRSNKKVCSHHWLE